MGAILKVILGEIFRFAVSLVRVKALPVAVVLVKFVLVRRLLLRAHDLHIVTDASDCKQGNNDKDNRADAAGIFLRLFRFSRFLRLCRLFFPDAAV